MLKCVNVRGKLVFFACIIPPFYKGIKKYTLSKVKVDWKWIYEECVVNMNLM